MEVNEAMIAELFAQQTKVTEVDNIIDKVMPDAMYEQRFPFHVMFYVMDINQCEMFIRSLVINLYKQSGLYTNYDRQTHLDKKGAMTMIEGLCGRDDGGALFIKTVAEFL